MYKCKYFKITELVHPDLLKSIGEEKCWFLLDDRLLRYADKLREKFGKITVNANGLTECGLRKIESDTGAIFSAHKYGRALDLHISTIEVEASKIKGSLERKNYKIKEYNKIREKLLSLSEYRVLNFEHNISWLHIDVANRENRLFYP